MINITPWPQGHKVNFKVTEVIAVFFTDFSLKIYLFENFELTAVSKRRSATIHEVYLVLTWRLGLCCRCLPLCSHREARDTRSNWEIWVFAYVFTVCEFSALYDSNESRIWTIIIFLSAFVLHVFWRQDFNKYIKQILYKQRSNISHSQYNVNQSLIYTV